jgi:hypothetical protein
VDTSTAGLPAEKKPAERIADVHDASIGSHQKVVPITETPKGNAVRVDVLAWGSIVPKS